jgi:hypothetical protein
MKGHPRETPQNPAQDHQEARARHEAPSAVPLIDDTMLRRYMADALPPEDLARVEKALRDSAQLRARLEDVRNNREDFQLHTLGAIWHRCRLTCASRQQLGSYLLDALDPQLAGYIRFHLDVIECPFCQANLADLERRQSGQPASVAEARGKRFLEATRELLGEERGRGT